MVSCVLTRMVRWSWSHLSDTCEQHFSDCFNVCYIKGPLHYCCVSCADCLGWLLRLSSQLSGNHSVWPFFFFFDRFFSGFFSRVINAGKSTHNEDQASCEVLTVKKKAGAFSSTPGRNTTKRRSSLPNGEGLQLKENSVRPSFIPSSQVRGTHTLWRYCEMFQLNRVCNGRERNSVPGVSGIVGLYLGYQSKLKVTQYEELVFRFLTFKLNKTPTSHTGFVARISIYNA